MLCYLMLTTMYNWFLKHYETVLQTVCYQYPTSESLITFEGAIRAFHVQN